MSVNGSKLKILLSKEVGVRNDYQAKVGPAWLATGVGGSGYNGNPPDPAISAAARMLPGAKPQPAVNYMFIDDQVLTENYWAAIQIILMDTRPGSPTLGKRIKCKLGLHCEGNYSYVPHETTRFWVDKLGRPQSMTAYWIEIVRPDVHLGPAPGGSGARIDLYFDGIPVGDPANYDVRTVGPYSFYPRDSSGVVVKTVHKTLGRANYTQLVEVYNAAVSEFIQTGRAIIAEIVDDNKDWAVGRRAESAIVPWLTRITAGIDLDAGLQCKWTLGDFANFPTQTYSAPGLNKLWYEAFHHDMGKSGGVVMNKTASHMVWSDHEQYCSHYPPSVPAFAQYGTGEGITALVRGRQPGYPIAPSSGYPPKWLSWCGYWHDLPGTAVQSLTVDVNNDIYNCSGSVVQDNMGGRYGGAVRRFGGFYSGLSTRPGDTNPGIGISYQGSAAWAGVDKTLPPGNPGVLRFWEGASASGATVTKGFTCGKWESVADFVARVNADSISFTLTDETTAIKLDCTFVHLDGSPTGSAMPLTQVLSSGLHLVLNQDIHAAGYAMNVQLGNQRVNTSVRNTRFFEYCGAATIACSTDDDEIATHITYWDHNILGCSWRDDCGFVNRKGQWQQIGVELGYWTGSKDGAAIAYCSFSAPSGPASPGMQMGGGVGGYKLMRNSVVSYSYIQPGNPPLSGVTLIGLVSPYQSMPSAALNSKFVGVIGATKDDALVFNAPAIGDVTLLDASVALLPDGVHYAGVFDAKGERQDGEA